MTTRTAGIRRPRIASTLSHGMTRMPSLPTLLGVDAVVHVDELPSVRDEAFSVGWGRKPRSLMAEARARRRGIPYLGLEDGFLRSVDLGVRGAPPLAVVVDDLGMHYDATRPSRLETMLEAPGDEGFDAALLAEAERAMRAIVDARIAKYNLAPERTLEPIPEGCEGRVLVVDQTAGDLAVKLGCPAPVPFDTMVEAALAEHPRAEILVNVHPDVAAGKKRGSATLLRDPRVKLLRAPVHPASLLDQVDAVYTMTSLLGFEALLRGKPVTCFGVPFYGGWGLTDDRARTPRRTRTRALREVFAAAFLRCSRYVDPETGLRTDVHRVIEHLALQRRYVEPAGTRLVGVGFSPWKQTFVPAFLGAPTNGVEFTPFASRSLLRGTEGRKAVVWGIKQDAAIARGGSAWRMEDGFLRSVGLGSDSHLPASLVVDRRGIYFDATGPSDLEHELEHGEFGEAELARARALRERIVALQLSKYNVGRRDALALPARAEGKRVVLVVGQVEDDASIRRGSVDVRKNLDLLREARAARPDAFVIWKPHPDVASGNRRGSVSASDAGRFADLVVADVALGACLGAVHEVHTMTSLVGFESLMRGLEVHVYGLPFYAGWGLTNDRHVCPRRTRTRTLDELVAATLLRYPRYVHPATKALTTPEAIVDALVAQRASARPEGPFAHLYVVRLGRKIRDLVRHLRAAR